MLGSNVCDASHENSAYNHLYSRSPSYMVASSYSVLPGDDFGSDSLRLVSIKPEHIESIRVWRNAQMRILRQKEPITIDEQYYYFHNNVFPLKSASNPTQILFAIYKSGLFIGYGGLVHISWPDLRSEMSFLLDPDIIETTDAYADIFREFLQILKFISFDLLGLHRIFAETYSFRNHHILTLESAGFAYEGLLRDHVIINNEYVDSLFHGCVNT